MQVRREAVFETNSSSTHSISIAGGDYVLDKLPVDPDGLCRVFPGEFGWEVEDYSDAATKASYALTFVKGLGDSESARLEPMLRDVIARNTGAASVEFVPSTDEYYEWGYIDHQSQDVCEEAFQSPETLAAFIFNPASTLHTDNDNH